MAGLFAAVPLSQTEMLLRRANSSVALVTQIRHIYRNTRSLAALCVGLVSRVPSVRSTVCSGVLSVSWPGTSCILVFLLPLASNFHFTLIFFFLIYFDIASFGGILGNL